MDSPDKEKEAQEQEAQVPQEQEPQVPQEPEPAQEQEPQISQEQEPQIPREPEAQELQEQEPQIPPEQDSRDSEPVSFPPGWLMCALGLCLILTGIYFSIRMEGAQSQAAGLRHGPELTARPSRAPRVDKLLPVRPSATPAVESPAVSLPPEVQSSPPPESSPGPTGTVPAEIGEVAVPEGTAYDKSWFADAVLIGDSRVNGFQLFSEVSEARYITSVGLSIYQVAKEEEVIRWGEDKISVYGALEKEQYAKVYLSMGVNELGYYNPEGFGETFGKVVDRVRQLQPDAAVYVMTVIPVNSEKCREHRQKSYVNNDLVAQYNEALVQMAREKDVYLVNTAEALADETGEVPAELSADGVHFQKEGYLIWRDYLLCHTGT